MAQRTSTSTLKEQMIKAARAAGGGSRTRAKREEAAARFHDWLRANNQQQRKIEDVAKVGLVSAWIASIESADRNKQNLMSLLRGMFRAAGFEKFADAGKNRLLTNKALGISGASRDGTHRPPTASEWQSVSERLQAPQYAREATLFELARTLGLRVEEAVQSVRSLKDWLRQLERGSPVRALHGTKGGKARDIFVPHLLRPAALAAVRNALALTRQHPEGYLVDKPDLKSALTRAQTVADAVGLVGEISPHSLRCDFAWKLADQLRAEGYDKASVLAQVSMSLGHGDGRGRYCAQVYLRGYRWDD